VAIVREDDVAGQTVKVEQQDSLIYVKLGFVGPKTLEQVENKPSDAIPLFKGFFITGNYADVRAELHKLIDQACDAHEEARRQQNG